MAEQAQATKPKPKSYTALTGVNLPPDDTRYEAGDTIHLVNPGPVERAALNTLLADGAIK